MIEQTPDYTDARRTAAQAQYPCPYCHELQAYSEARPSKPHIIIVGHWQGKRWNPRAKETEYQTECRACGQRIIWSMRYGNGSLEQLGSGAARYSWSKP